MHMLIGSMLSPKWYVRWEWSLCSALTCPPGAEGLRVEFDRQCSTERRHDPLTVMDGVNRIVSVRSGGTGGGAGTSATSWNSCSTTEQECCCFVTRLRRGSELCSCQVQLVLSAQCLPLPLGTSLQRQCESGHCRAAGCLGGPASPRQLETGLWDLWEGQACTT